MIKLENWSVVHGNHGNTDSYIAPEFQSLRGKVYNHPRHKDGTVVKTSRIIEISGKIVKTYSGSVYELGEVSPEYVDWMKKNNIEMDQENPIKFVN